MFEELKKVSKESEEMAAKLRKTAQDMVAPAIKKAFLELVADVPSVEAIRWAQYIPGFNDGDACVFSVSDVYVKITGYDKDDEGDGFVYIGNSVKNFLGEHDFESLRSLTDEIRPLNEDM